jgi:peptidoglycan-associated lipoprotein
MRFKLLPVFAAAAFLAACSSDPATTANTGGGGSNVTAPTTSATPGGIVAGSREDFVVNVGDRVFFGFDQYNLSSDAQTVLRRQAAWLQKYPTNRVTVEGHADERGTREYNLALGERRANAVRDFLVANGVQPTRINSVSYGKERPAVLGSNDAAWAQNRRGVTVVQ